MRCYPSVLVISNECFSNSSSNGRTLRNFFEGWPLDKLAQFYIHGTAPDDQICNRYYCVSDGAALCSFLSGKTTDGKRERMEPVTQCSGESRKIQRDAVSMMIRNLVWNSMRWAGSAFYSWVEEFHPELILLQAGDSAFMLRLARKLSQRYCIPLVIYNSEAYYFKRYDYFRSTGIARLGYPFFHRIFCQEFEKTIKAATCSIYCCDKLKRDYDLCFGLLSHVVFTASQLVSDEKVDDSRDLQISYLGNLGLDRHVGLVEIGNALQQISPDLKLDVYGKLPHAEAEQAFRNCGGINYRGFVSYEKVQEVISDSDILVHTESFEDFYKEDLKYAFSTKIADSLASGRCFLLYAPEELACTEYLREHQAAWVVDKREDLLPVLQKLVEDPSARKIYIDRARRLAEENHRMEKNAQKFQWLLHKCAEERL